MNESGLSDQEAARRLRDHGPNTLPAQGLPSLALVFLRQFLSPLIYILVAAALVSLALDDPGDAAFIGVVLLLNGIIGTAQEYSANRAAAALRDLVQPRATVLRSGVPSEIDARNIVPGDLVLLSAGAKVPADLLLVSAEDLRLDEALLTGESRAVAKFAGRAGPGHEGQAFAGTMVTRGRASGIVTATGRATEVGRIAEVIAARSISKPPLVIRMDRFARAIALSVGVALALLVVGGLLREMPMQDLFLMAVGLAVSAIPEGLPVAISVALAIGMRKMAAQNVVIRKMPAIESLGSCTMIATDKTGTLTLNELTVTEIRLPDGTSVVFQPGHDLDDCEVLSPGLDDREAKERSASLLRAAALPNEARLERREDRWAGSGDSVDVALLAAVRKAGLAHEEMLSEHPLVARIPYEPDLKYAASFHGADDGIRIFVKGAPETLIAMASHMDSRDGRLAIDRAALLRQEQELAGRGLRVLAFAEGAIDADQEADYGHRHLVDLNFLGLAGMQDPLRPEVPDAIRACRRAGVEVSMITGDDARTASAIATTAGIAFDESQVVTGDVVGRAESEGEDALDRLTRNARIYARVRPDQKLSIVLSMARNGHFVAVTGDGVNDAPALKHAHVGVAMGLKGTDLARESADVIVSDDNFASIVAGIREGRIAYANIRKVIFMLVSTGAAEVALFLLAIPFGFAMPLLPVQLLWLNLVTNGIQDVALAGEKGEGDELDHPPRRPDEPIFDRTMIRRIVVSTIVMGGGGFLVYVWLLRHGYGEAYARNLLLLLFVLFENFQTFNSRSERHSVFRQSIFANPLLVLGVVGTQALHVAAMNVGWFGSTLDVAPVTLEEWAALLALASSILVVMEIDKLWEARRSRLALRRFGAAGLDPHQGGMRRSVPE